MDMFIVYLGLFILGLIGVLYLGLKLSESIMHPTLLIFFWVLYIASVLTVSNIVATGLFYNVLRYKRGVPGEQGRIGEKGDLGFTGVCDVGCDSKVCNITILDNINKFYGNLIQNILGKTAIVNEKAVIKNNDILGRIKQLCESQAYKEISAVRTPKMINDYVSDIYQTWIKLLVDTDNSDQKRVIRDYLETEGMEEKPVLPNDVFREIEKYDVYYWGADRIFHPRVIEYCADPNDYPKMSKTPSATLMGLRTNFYTQIFSSVGAAGSKLSIFRAGPYNYQGSVYHSLGDIPIKNINVESGEKFIEKYGVPDKERTEFSVNLKIDGPATPTLLLTSSENYLKPPQDWVMIWRNKKKPELTIWKPKDFYDTSLNKWFRACGFLAMPNWQNATPRQQFGYNTPDRQPIRLVNEDLLEDITDTGFTEVWNDKNSGVKSSISMWNSKDKDYLENQNSPLVVSGYQLPADLKIYKVKKDAFIMGNMKPLDFKDPLIDEDELGVGFHGAPHRSAKYSVFTFLGMPLEVQLSNIATADKVYLKHTGLNKVNSYMLRRQHVEELELSGAFGISSDSKIAGDNNKYNVSNNKLIWEIVCVDKNGEIDPSCNSKYYLIKSSVNKKYFKIEQQKKLISYMVDVLPQKTNIEYTNLLKNFMWFQPQSATGNAIKI